MGEFARNFISRWKGTNRGKMKPSECPGSSCLDLTATVRPKIFLLVKKITASTNTEATVFGGLCVQNQVTMQIIINFLDLKKGEMWVEMMEEFQEEKVALVSSDQEALNSFHRIGRNKVAAVLDTQQYLLRRSKEHDEISERELYALLKDCKLQDHLLASQEVQYLARSSNYLYMVEKRLWQKSQLKIIESLQKDGSEARLHRTSAGKLNCTVWPAKKKVVSSEPKFNSRFLDTSNADSTVLAETFLLPTSSSQYWSGAALQLDTEESDELLNAMHEKANEIPDGSRDSVRSITKHVSATTVKSPEKSYSETPRSAEEGFYQVSPILLKKVLVQLATDQKKWNWEKILEDENSWMMRTKWKSDWYPEGDTVYSWMHSRF